MVMLRINIVYNYTYSDVRTYHFLRVRVSYSRGLRASFKVFPLNRGGVCAACERRAFPFLQGL